MSSLPLNKNLHIINNFFFFIIDKILCAGLIDISRDQTSAAGHVIDIDRTLIPNETIECLHTWPSDDDIKEAIRIGYDEARALANYLEINNCTSNSIQQQISYNETSLDNNTIKQMLQK
ncbi:hypothetical protein RhiirB3_470290 [Rhizophagus irregularis]|nr:hypothetical protein RhiirB3_470290 [Rhizophagus irregularis]